MANHPNRSRRTATLHVEFWDAQEPGNYTTKSLRVDVLDNGDLARLTDKQVNHARVRSVYYRGEDVTNWAIPLSQISG